MQKLVNLKNQKLIADNKKARYNYFIEEEIECGIVLEGSEVKSMRNGRVSILESYANIEQQQLWLINCHVPNYENAKTFNHVERRRRKLLVKKRELLKKVTAINPEIKEMDDGKIAVGMLAQVSNSERGKEIIYSFQRMCEVFCTNNL